MPKGKPGKTIKARPGARPVRSGGAAPGVLKLDRRQPRTIETPDVAREVRSDAMRLAAEVERLERELAAARSQMATLAARIDIDPLTELPNRRAFERELARSLAYVKRHG